MPTFNSLPRPTLLALTIGCLLAHPLAVRSADASVDGVDVNASTETTATTTAATPAAPARPAPRRARELGEIEVTADALPPLQRSGRAATRLDLPVLELPASVDIITQGDLRRRFETGLSEALDNAPGLSSWYSFGTLQIGGRGFAGLFNSPILFDGIRYPGFQIAPRSSLAYAQLEVLRGPAALTAGQGSIGGAINLVPRKADGQRELALYTALGRFGTSTAAVGAGGEMAPGGLRYRVDATWQGSDSRGSYGFARDTSFGFGHLVADLALPVGDALTLGLSIDRFRDDAEGYFGSPLVNGRIDERLRDINYNVVDDQLDMDVSWLRLRAEWRPGDTFGARAVAFWNDETRDWRNAEAYTFQPATNTVRRSDYLEIRHEQGIRGVLAEGDWRHELAGMPHQLVVGLQADRNDHDRFNDSPFRFNDTVPLFPTTRGVYRSIDPFGLRTATDIDQRAAYLESRLDLGERTRLLSGFRHDRTEVESFNALTNVRFDRRYVSNGWRAGLTRELFDGGLLYGSYATSSEPPAQITTLGLANAPFDLTDGKQFELGWKQEFTRGDLTIAAYDLRRTNILSRDPADPNRFIQIGEQAGTGLEIGARVRVAEAWSIEGSAAVVDARFVRFDERVGTQLVSRRGNQPTGVPEEVGTLWLAWEPNARLRAAVGARGVGRRPANTANTVWLPGYATIDATVSWSTEVGLFGARVRNIGDRFYATGGYNAANQALIGEPRWYEVVWQRRFF